MTSCYDYSGVGAPDFNGDCQADVAIGAPTFDSGALADTGAIQVIYSVDSAPSSRVLTSATLGYPVNSGAQFGTALAVTEVSGDLFDDLVIGAPGTPVGGSSRAGAIYVVYGSAAGLGAGRRTARVTELSLGLPRQSSRFGTALTAWPSGYNEPDQYRLAVGAPHATVNGAANAGHLVLVSPSLELDAVISQGRGSPGRAEAGDRFGSAVAFLDEGYTGTYVAVGAPREDVGSAANAGAVTILGRRGAWIVSQDSAGVPGTAERGDHFGAAVAPFGGGVLVAAPEEDVGSTKDAGGLVVLTQSSASFTAPPRWVAGRHLITTASPGFPGRLEAGDRMGSTLKDNLVGIPYKDIGSRRDAGRVCAIADITAAGRAPAACFSQNSRGVPGASETGDRFGQALTTVTPQSEEPPLTIIVGTPGEDVGGLKDRGLVQLAEDQGTFPMGGGIPVVRNLPAPPAQRGAGWGRALS